VKYCAELGLGSLTVMALIAAVLSSREHARFLDE
jgi:hypothetical protein